MDDQKRRDDGMARRRKVLGNAWVDKANAGRNSFNTEFQDLITRYAWNEVWTRPHFDERMDIGNRNSLLALCQWDEFRLHMRAALTEGGFTPEDIKEIVLQQTIYCGVPAANHAMREASAVLRELGLLKASAPGRAATGISSSAASPARAVPLCAGRFDQEHDRGAEQHQQFRCMQPKRLGLADLGRHHHAGETDHAADRRAPWPRASSPPPVLRIEGQVMKTRKIAKRPATVSLPSANSQAARIVGIAARCRWSLMNSATAMLGRS